MRKYRVDATSETRVDYGLELEEGLRFFPETAQLAQPLAGQDEALEQLRLVREKTERALIPIRARVRFADYDWDQTARSTSRAAEILDGGTRGLIHRAVFKDGLTSVVVASGAAQLSVAKDFITHLGASKAPGVEGLRAEWLPKLQAACGRLEAACAARSDALMAVATARAAEAAAKDDHEVAVEKLMGEVRAIFPKDRKRWDVIFPRSSATVATEQPVEPPPGEPSTPGAAIPVPKSPPQ
ncbi:MAG: hypothetical protein MUF54_12570 [Polyangiaceae bacterium]|jgi:hypothetical protein|nr:hypothetical protein [Polyangiaceae bacterium]